MSLRSSLPRRIAMTAAVAGLLTAAAAVPAVADGGGDGGDPGTGQSATAATQQGGTWSQGGETQATGTQSGTTWNQGADSQGTQAQGGGDGNQHGNPNNQRLYRGRVTASTLALRAAPNRGGQIIRYAHRGEIVSIFCKTGGQNVDGNRLWYLLTDGTWAWGSARYIDNIGAAPRWC
ncbi:SH3 domain-containing protein [Streptomyces sp. NPDC005574]|uniref:SH3 domain-containing protein n=1 Tax=Streptomyces sp. NPDC005574 TaxID=3156891 RepID=UPI0033B7BEB4